MSNEVINFIKDMHKAGRSVDEIIVYVVAKFHLNYSIKLEEQIYDIIKEDK